MERVESVDAYIAQSDHREALQILRDIVLETELKETLKWSVPTYTYRGKNIVGIGSFKSYFGLWFFQGALLEDPQNKLINAQEGKTKALRQWRFESIGEIDPEVIHDYVREAIRNEEAGLSIKPQKKPLVVPPELLDALEKKNLRGTFESLPLSHKREFSEYIMDAKRIETKERRLEKILPMIEAGISMNDKYRK